MSPTTPGPEIIFYDGHCALCHRAVKFALRHDPAGGLFRFALLQGAFFSTQIPAARRAALPDSIVVLASDGSLLTRSDAFLHILRRIGGRWGSLATVLAIAPRFLRDPFYNLVARTRYRLFGRRTDVCPVVPVELRERFRL